MIVWGRHKNMGVGTGKINNGAMAIFNIDDRYTGQSRTLTAIFWNLSERLVA